MRQNVTCDNCGCKWDILDKGAQRLKKTARSSHKSHGGRFTTGDDESVALGEVVGGADLDGFEMERGEMGGGFADEGDVFCETALEGEDAYGFGHFETSQVETKLGDVGGEFGRV